MTLQAMALQHHPLSPTPRPLPPEVSLTCPRECWAAVGYHCASLSQNPTTCPGKTWSPWKEAGMSQETYLTPYSPQKPLAPEARPKFVGTGPPAKPVLLRCTPKPLTPAPPAKASRPPTKPVAAPILAQDRASPETSECRIPTEGCFLGQDWERGLTLSPALNPGPQLCPAQSWSGIRHSTRSTSRSPRSRSRTSLGSTSSHLGEVGLKSSGQRCPHASPPDRWPPHHI